MALSITVSHGSGLIFTDAYWMIGAVEHQIVNRSIRVAVVGYVNVERRDSLKAAGDSFDKANAALQKAKSDWEKSPQGQERESAYDDYVIADRTLKKAAQAINDLEALPIPADMHTISGEDYATCLTQDNDVSRARVYEWLKRQPKWLDAKDI